LQRQNQCGHQLNATTGWWKSNGVDFTEDKTDSSSKSITESASIDSGKAVWGKAFSLMACP
jgi:hypothetical protein